MTEPVVTIKVVSIELVTDEESPVDSKESLLEAINDYYNAVQRFKEEEQ